MIVDLAQAARDYYAETDAEGEGAFRRWLSPNCRLRFNNEIPIVGSDNVREFTLGRRQSFQFVRHRIDDIVVDPQSGTVAMELTVEYLTDKGAEVSVHGASFLNFIDGYLEDLRVYVDPRPVTEALERESP